MVDKLGAATALEGVATCIQPPEVGVQLLGAAHALRQLIGAPVPPVAQSDYTTWMERLHNQLDEMAFAHTWDEGEALSYEGAVTVALAHLGSYEAMNRE